MYYLMTRYYDPHTGGFFNVDNLNYLEPKTISGLNLYAYCRKYAFWVEVYGGN